MKRALLLSSPSRWLPAAVAVAAGIAGCAGSHIGIEANEAFNSSATFSRTYAALDSQACEAARRALLSQGYVISAAGAEQVRGRKSFQPRPDAHVEVEFNITCAKEGSAGRRTIAFVNAVQENYTLKKSSSSASVGVTPFGSLSLPFLGSDESLVKVASVTITSAAFYGRFFKLVERYLEGDPGQPIAAAIGGALDAPLPVPLPPTKVDKARAAASSASDPS